jgi:hypothetical protein
MPDIDMRFILLDYKIILVKKIHILADKIKKFLLIIENNYIMKINNFS